MKNKLPLLLFLMIACLSISFVSQAKTDNAYADSTPVTTDAKTIVSNYIAAIGGMDAIKKVNNISATGNLIVQGMSLSLVQKQMTPNKTLQTVIMGGNTVGKTVFDGTKGYAEQMGNRIDMTEDQMADLKGQSSLFEQTDYLTNAGYKLTVQGTGKVNNADAYKVLVTKPTGKIDTEYYDMASRLLVKKVSNTSANGQNITTEYTFSDYKKASDIMLPFTTDVAIGGSMIPAFKIALTDIKINEGVTEADFE